VAFDVKFCGFITRRTNLSGAVVGLREITTPNNDEVKWYQQAVNHAEGNLWSHVSLSICLAFSGSTSKLFLKYCIVSESSAASGIL